MSTACSPPTALTPPTPSRQGRASSSRFSHSDNKPPRGLLLPLHGTNGCTPPVAPSSASGFPALCTPVDTVEHHTPPSGLRRESLQVPPSDRMVRMAQGSGVSVYRMDRSPREGRPRSPWVLKKANVSPLLVRIPTRHAPLTDLATRRRARAPAQPNGPSLASDHHLNHGCRCGCLWSRCRFASAGASSALWSTSRACSQR